MPFTLAIIILSGDLNKKTAFSIVSLSGKKDNIQDTECCTQNTVGILDPTKYLSIISDTIKSG